MYADDKIRLQHIIEEAKEAVRFIKGHSFEDFVKDGKTVRAVISSLLKNLIFVIMSEAKDLFFVGDSSAFSLRMT